MKIKWKTLIFCVALPLAVGGLSAFFTKNSMATFQDLNQPPLAPPGWVFPVVWTILFVLMGLASYLVSTSGAERNDIAKAWKIYGTQLAVNFFWSVIFFNLRWFLFAFLWLLLLWVLILLTLVKFYRIRSLAGYLLTPYLLWVTFAGYLNFGIFLSN